jgi:glutathione S-transferase
LKLFYFPIAPNPTKVRIYLGEKGLELPTELVNLIEGEQKQPEFLAKNPIGKLPVLELDDGSFLTESLAIIEYLEELHPEPSMWGSTPDERAHARKLERLCDLGVLISIARCVHATNSPLGLPPNPAVADAALGALNDSLTILDAALADGRSFVAGERVTVGDCSLFAGLAFGSFRGVEIDPKYDHVLAWRERFAKRPAASPGG